MRAKTVAGTTLGCKVNFYETEAMLSLFAAEGYTVVDFEDTADIYIVNTCTVTGLGDKKSRQMLRRAHTRNPEALVIASGCYAQVAPGEIAGIEGVDLIVGTSNRMRIVRLAEEQLSMREVQRCVVSDIMQERSFEPLAVSGMQDRHRAYIKIQEGCDRYCAYCIIPYARGPVRSRLLPDVLDEVRRLAANGYKEIVLSGIHVASYGKDLGNVNLLRALEAVHNVEGIERIRMSSVEPTIVNDEFAVAAASLPKLCNHFHLSLQSGCDRTLQHMNRRYTTKDYGRAVDTLRDHLPDVSLTTDVIVGFPGETEADFEACYAYIEALGLTRLHVFPYSAKKGTPAAAFPDQIPKHIKDERARRLTGLSKALHEGFLNRFVGCEMDVLFEQSRADGFFEGHTTNYLRVLAPASPDVSNKILSVRIDKITDETAYGAVLRHDI